jgi:hypothetical protein
MVDTLRPIVEVVKSRFASAKDEAETNKVVMAVAEACALLDAELKKTTAGMNLRMASNPRLAADSDVRDFLLAACGRGVEPAPLLGRDHSERPLYEAEVNRLATLVAPVLSVALRP